MSGPAFTIRAGVPEDGGALLKVHRRSILTLGRAGYTEKETRSWAAKLVPEGYGEAMTEGGETFEVVLDPGGDVIAFCSRKDEEVMGLYVDPSWVRRGIGTALLARAEAAIQAAGHRRVLIGASLTGQGNPLLYLGRQLVRWLEQRRERELASLTHFTGHLDVATHQPCEPAGNGQP